MKKLIKIIVSVLFLQSLAYAAGNREFLCEGYQQSPHGLRIHTVLKGTLIDMDGRGNYQIDDLFSCFLVDYSKPGKAAKCSNVDFRKFHSQDRHSFYAYGLTVKSYQSNVADYRPIKYRNHLKFNLDYAFETSGRAEFITPATISGEYFASYMILSHISDHFGTTVPMKCRAL